MIVDEVKAEGRFSIIETCAVDDDQAENPFIEENKSDEGENQVKKRNSSEAILTRAANQSPFDGGSNNGVTQKEERTSWAPTGVGSSKIQEKPVLDKMTPSSLREFRSSAPTKLTPRSLFAFQGQGRGSGPFELTLHQEEEEESVLVEEGSGKKEQKPSTFKKIENEEVLKLTPEPAPISPEPEEEKDTHDDEDEEDLEEIPMDQEMKKEVFKMVHDSISPVNPLDDSFSVLSKEIQRTIEKKKPVGNKNISMPVLNLRARQFTPPSTLMKPSFQNPQPPAGVTSHPPPGFAHSQFYSPIATALSQMQQGAGGVPNFTSQSQYMQPHPAGPHPPPYYNIPHYNSPPTMHAPPSYYNPLISQFPSSYSPPPPDYGSPMSSPRLVSSKSYRGTVGGVTSNLPPATVLLETNAPVGYLDLLDNVLAIAVEQSGYKLIERELNRIGPHSENGKTLFNKLLPYFERISNDPLGNFMAQIMIQTYYRENIRTFYNSIRQNFLSTCESIHGTRVIQRIIEYAHQNLTTIANNEGYNVLQLFKKDIRGLVKTISTSAHGNYVIQAALLELKNEFEYTDPIFEELRESCVQLSTHKHGCCVMQKAFELGSAKDRQYLAQEVIKNLEIIMPDEYGNYVIQFMVKLGMAPYNQQLCQYIISNLVPLSNEKCSSNVVEKCIMHCSRANQDMLVDYITNTQGVIDALLFNQYGNYVIQTALSVLPKNSRRFLMLVHKVKYLMNDLYEAAAMNSQLSQIYSRLTKKHPELISEKFGGQKKPKAYTSPKGIYARGGYKF